MRKSFFKQSKILLSVFFWRSVLKRGGFVISGQFCIWVSAVLAFKTNACLVSSHVYTTVLIGNGVFMLILMTTGGSGIIDEQKVLLTAPINERLMNCNQRTYTKSWYCNATKSDIEGPMKDYYHLCIFSFRFIELFKLQIDSVFWKS